MSTLSQFNTARDNNLGDTAPDSPSTPLRDPVCDRTIFNLIKDEFFSSIIQDTQATTNVFTKISTAITYKASAKKVGNAVTFMIAIINTSGSTIATNTELLYATNSLYFPLAMSGETKFYLNGFLNRAPIIPCHLALEMSTGKFTNGVSILSGETLRVSGTYYVAD
jgi:hypothetical protein